MDQFLTDLTSEHWAELVPPEPYHLMAGVDAAFMRWIFNIAQLKWKSDVHHHCQANDFW